MKTGELLGLKRFPFALGAAKAAAAIPLPFPVPIRLHIDPNWRVAAYAAVLAILAAVASGLVPAWQSVKESLSAGMHGERKHRARRILVVAQIALSFVVLTTAVLFLENLAHSSSLSPGFDTRRTIHAEVYLPPGAYNETREMNLYVSRALGGLLAIPSIESAAAARIVPFTDNMTFASPITFPDTGEKQQAVFYWNAVTPDYFRAMDIPILMGRTFTSQDNGAAHVVIVNDIFVRRYLGTRALIGTTFVWGKNQLYRIVGVVRATKNMTIGEDPVAQLFEPLSQIRYVQQQIQFVVRSATPPAAQLAAVRQTLRLAEPAAGLKVETMSAHRRDMCLKSCWASSYNCLPRESRSDWALALFVTRPLAVFFVPGLKASDPASFLLVIAVLGAPERWRRSAPCGARWV